MTQADGIHPTSREIRDMLGAAKQDTERYVAALTAAAVVLDKSPRIDREMELLAALTAAHRSLTLHMEATFTVLGLPYEAVIEAEFEEIV